MLLVTGGTGFIGREVVSSLLEKDQVIRLLVRDAEKAKNTFPNAGIEIVQGDITKPHSLEGITKDIDTVIHLAGTISYSDANLVYKTNLEGTRNLLSFCSNVDKFIFSSSVSVFSRIKEPVNEETPCNPRDDYGKSKLETEELIIDSGLPAIILRIAPVYGTGSPWWIKILGYMSKGYPAPKTENSTQIIHLSDVANAINLSLNKKAKGGVYIIADEERVKVLDIINILSNHLSIKPKFMPLWLAKSLAKTGGGSHLLETLIGHRHYDITKAKEFLKFKPSADMQEEMRKMVEWYLGEKSKVISGQTHLKI